MCGIAGLIHKGKTVNIGKELQDMLQALKHRGPDSTGFALYGQGNNPGDYKNARWSHPGFKSSQVNTSAPIDEGNEGGVPYAIWSISITTTPADAGKKWATCEFQQGDFPLSTDFKFLILKKLPKSEKPKKETPKALVYKYIYVFVKGTLPLEETDVNKQIEDDIKRQISGNYELKPSKVRRCGKYKNRFCITVKQMKQKPKGNQKRKSIPIQGSTSTKKQKQQQPNKKLRHPLAWPSVHFMFSF